METLNPLQRVVVIAFGLVLTALVALYVLPWAGNEIVSRLPPTATPRPATATPVPTPSPTWTPTAAPSPTVAITPPPEIVLLQPMVHAFQTQGKGGPASLSIAVSQWGYTDTQEVIASVVCPGELDSHAGMDELAEYARSRGLEAHLAANGNLETLRSLLANGFPVIVARWITTTEQAETYRYQVLRGYDGAGGWFTAHDSLIGPDLKLPYDEMDPGWEALGRPYLLVFPIDESERLQAILGPEAQSKTMWENALERAEEETETDADAENALAWLNQASALTQLSQFEEALAAFEKAVELGPPDSLLWYRFEIFECLLNLKAYDRLIALTQPPLDRGMQSENLHLYRAQAYTGKNDPAKARVEYEQALLIHPGWAPAEQGLNSLPE